MIIFFLAAVTALHYYECLRELSREFRFKSLLLRLRLIDIY